MEAAVKNYFSVHYHGLWRQMLLAGLLLCLVTPQAYASDCDADCYIAHSGGAWAASSFAAQQSDLMIEVDLTPSASRLDGIFALARGMQSQFSGYAALVRFNDEGRLDVRFADHYSSDLVYKY